MEVAESGRFQHIVHLTVRSGTGRISAVSHQYEVFLGLLLGALPYRSIEASSQNTGYFFRVFHRIEQGSAYAYLLEERQHAFHITAERLHFHAVDDIGALHDNVRIALSTQLEQRVQRGGFVDAARLEAAYDDARSVGFAKFQAGKSLARLGIDGVNRLRARIVVRRAEVHHKQRGLFAGFHTCEHIARHEVSPFVRGAEERNGKEQGEKRGFHKRK